VLSHSDANYNPHLSGRGVWLTGGMGNRRNLSYSFSGGHETEKGAGIERKNT
jgi:hypothetical protein